MAVFSRDPREHWLKPQFSENQVANSGRGNHYQTFHLLLSFRGGFAAVDGADAAPYDCIDARRAENILT